VTASLDGLKTQTASKQRKSSLPPLQILL
jgi:hypothetical protein